MSLLNSSNPFVGLRPFESDESLLFFGRQEQTLELLQRLHQHHFVAVVGSSGSGKSSLIRAGLIPSLKAGYLVDDRDHWMITVMKPGQSPLYNLADAILNQLKSGIAPSAVTGLLNKLKEEGSDAVLHTIQSLWEEKNTNFFLLVDQFEELFRFSMEQKEVAKRDEAIDFVNIILELSRQIDLPLYVVITMRSDFIGDCAQFNGLPESMNMSQYLVPRLNRVQLKTAIEGPVKLYGGNINIALISRLLNDVGTIKDELPLLQHALMRVWDHEVNVDKSGELDLKDYESIGGIDKALSNHADEALKGMSEEELSLTKKMFQALTAVDENGRKIRRPARLKELEEITDATEQQLLGIINRFIEDRRSFLVINKTNEQDDAVIDISHESLIRQWGTLSGWVDEEAEASKNYFRLVESMDLYRDKKKDLLTGSELHVALKWCKEFKPVPAWAQRYSAGFEGSIGYLEESQKYWKIEQQKKKARKRNQLALIFGLIALVVFVLLFFGYQRAAQAEVIAKYNADKANASAKQANLLDVANKSLEKQKKAADSIASVAVEEKINADSSAAKARKAQHEAEVQKEMANLFASGLKAASDSVAIKTKTIKQLSRSYHLHELALDLQNTDPTLALRLEEAAIQINQDPTFFSEAERIYAQNSFYKTILKDSFTLYTFSPDGTKALGLQTEYTSNRHSYTKVSLFDLKKKKVLFRQIYNYQSSLLTNGSFSPDGTKVLAALGDSVALWTLDGRMIIKPRMFKLPSLMYPATRFFSLEGSKIFGFRDSAIIVWNIDDTSLKILKNRGRIKVALSPGNKKILAIINDTLARLWNTKDSRFTELHLPSGMSNIVSSAISPDGAKVLTGSRDGSIHLWDSSGKLTGTLNGHAGLVTSIKFSSDGKRILTGSTDNTARLWDNQGRSLEVLKAHSPVTSVAFNSDDRIFTGSSDSTISVWNFPASKFLGHTNEINLVAFSPDGTKILTGSADSTSILWNLAGKQLNLIKQPDQVASVAFSKNNTKFLTASGNTTTLWNINGKFERKFAGHTQTVQSVAFSPNDKKILTGSDDGTARLQNLNDTEDDNPTLFRHSRGITSVAFSKDGAKILTGGRDSIVKLWDNSGKLLKIFTHAGIVYCATFSPDNSKILTGSEDKTAILWTLTGDSISTFRHGAPIESVAFSPDGTKVLTGSWDNSAKLWNINGELLNLFEMPYPVKVRSVAFSPDGSKIFIGASDGIGRLYDLRTFQEFLKSDEIDILTDEQKRQFGIAGDNNK